MSGDAGRGVLDTLGTADAVDALGAGVTETPDELQATVSTAAQSATRRARAFIGWI